MKMEGQTKWLAPYLDKIRAIDFVKELEFKRVDERADYGLDGQLAVVSPKGKFHFDVEHQSSYLDRAFLHALISRAKRGKDSSRRQLLLMARYVPQPAAEALIENGINFVDRVGNLHLSLGSNYVRTVTGKKETEITRRRKPLSPADAKLLFTFAAYEQSENWPVRELASAAGIGKSSVAKIRQQLVERGLLHQTRGAFKIVDKKTFGQELLRGYSEVLRPRLLINRFRAAETSTEVVIKRVTAALQEIPVRWSLTGGPAAYELHRFYRGAEIPIFIDAFSENMVRHVRLLPDPYGPIMMLRSFGTVPYWREVGGMIIAHPWLIYAELIYSADPRAHEAAEELKDKFLE